MDSGDDSVNVKTWAVTQTDFCRELDGEYDASNLVFSSFTVSVHITNGVLEMVLWSINDKKIYSEDCKWIKWGSLKCKASLFYHCLILAWFYYVVPIMQYKGIAQGLIT